MTPGGTHGPTGLVGSARGGRIRRDREGEGCEGWSMGQESPGLLRRPPDATALVMRPPASTDAGTGARADPGRALSPTASVMKATWMKSESQLSTYMNHMAPPPRPPPSAGTGLRASAPATRSRRHRRRVPAPRTARGPCAAAERSRAGAPSPAEPGLAPPAGAEDQPAAAANTTLQAEPGPPGAAPRAGPATPPGEAGRCPGAGMRRLPEGQPSGHSQGAPALAWRGSGAREGRLAAPQPPRAGSLKAGRPRSLSCCRG